MEKITVAKFGGSTIGAYGIGIAEIVKRVQHLAKESKINTEYDFARIKRVYEGVLENIPEKCRQSCRKIIDRYLEKCLRC